MLLSTKTQHKSLKKIKSIPKKTTVIKRSFVLVKQRKMVAKRRRRVFLKSRKGLLRSSFVTKRVVRRRFQSKGTAGKKFILKRKLTAKRSFIPNRRNSLRRVNLLSSRFRRRSLQRSRLQRRRIMPKVIVPPVVSQVNRMQNGINLIGYIRTEIGIGEGSRLMAKAIEAADIPFLVMNYTDAGAQSARNLDLSWQHKEAIDPLYRVNLIHLNADALPGAHVNLGHNLFHERCNIGYWAWELAEFPDEWCGSFQYLQEVWVPTAFITDAVSRKSTIPVIRIPHAIEVSNATEVNREIFGLPQHQFLFLSMYDTHSLIERKNPLAAIKAFKLAFPKTNRSVGLVIKVNNASSNEQQMNHLRQQIEGYDNIYLIHETMNRALVNVLINSTDCFVSLHRSEGFGLVLAEAMYMGKPVIGTGWSGNMDFMNAVNSCPIKYQLLPIGRDIGPYKANQIWAEPDIEHAAFFMGRLVKDERWRNEIAFNGQQTIRTDFSAQVVGNMVRQRLNILGKL